MVCHFLELLKVKFIKELSVDSRKTGVKEVKHIDAALSLIELVIVCCIHFLEELSVMIVFSLLNILHLISLWKEMNVEE
jgi:hypothetical protein